ncbi:hypothetical protein DHEL01_v206974 [Diaporthe helianthi]|uniref:Uncharacterized protein n=1 Tax=Diaporthe helianthi TaxID=158607 RepID=A0A2P5HWK6_DIAHE|nr:hypothetical protein DHEL01_v206974 [Diaporthe helianthi]
MRSVASGGIDRNGAAVKRAAAHLCIARVQVPASFGELGQPALEASHPLMSPSGSSHQILLHVLLLRALTPSHAAASGRAFLSR